ncbi:glycosyltransferase [Cryptobacterium sp. CAG:338]|mgnify:CR=1 FL=1|nr:glycosyltransferase [Cryptobacterium sp. CAG:338]
MNFLQRVYWKLYRTLIKPDDVNYLRKQFKLNLGYEPDINNPRSFNEALLWLKLNWRNDLCYRVVDKYEVRNYIKEKGLVSILTECYGLYNSIDDVIYESLPNKFVIKNTGDSGGVKVVRSRSDFDAAKSFFHSLNNGDFSDYAKEWVYSKLKNRIIVEELIECPDGHSPKDYKFFCFSGEPKFLFVGTERDVDVKFDFFDLNWNHLPVHQGHEWASVVPKKPGEFDEMIEISKILSRDFPMVRVDLYNENGRVYFGELTFFHFGGIVPFVPRSFDFEFGKFFSLDSVPDSERVDFTSLKY